MADQDDRTGVVLQIVFQPDHRLDVQVVRRFIQQQHAGLCEEQLGQGDAHLPAAAEFIREPVQILVGKAQAHQHALDARLHFREVVVLQADLEVPKDLKSVDVLAGGRVVGPQSLACLVKLALQLHRVLKRRLRLRHQGAPLHLHPFLGRYPPSPTSP